MPEEAEIQLNVYNGARRLMGSDLTLSIIIRDGYQRPILVHDYPGPSINFKVPFRNDLSDRYAVIASADGYRQIGFAPVKVMPDTPRILDLMLLPNQMEFNFAAAAWENLQHSYANYFTLLSEGAQEPEAAQRYQALMTGHPGSLAALFNILTAMKDIQLPVGTALSYFKSMIWKDETMLQDRFFAYADQRLVGQVKQAAHQGHFDPQWGVEINHPGATSSYKQNQFGEANVQLSFHEKDTARIGEVDCVMVECDMDYYKDDLAHLIFEVMPNKITKGKTDPRQIYMLRWIAGRHAGVPEFDPPYTLEPA